MLHNPVFVWVGKKTYNQVLRLQSKSIKSVELTQTLNRMLNGVNASAGKSFAVHLLYIHNTYVSSLNASSELLILRKTNEDQQPLLSQHLVVVERSINSLTKLRSKQ